MKKILLISSATLFIQTALSCSEVYNGSPTAGYVEGRTLDFAENLGTKLYTGYPQMLNTSRIVPLDGRPLDNPNPASWRNIYGFTGRSAWDSDVIEDGMNTQGLTVSLLELDFHDGGKYLSPGDPNLDPNKKNLGVFDLPNFILSQASNIAQVKQLIQAYNIVNTAGKVKGNDYINLGQHFVFTDANGGRLIVEFTQGSNGLPVFIENTSNPNDRNSEMTRALTNNRMDNFNEGPVPFPEIASRLTNGVMSYPLLEGIPYFDALGSYGISIDSYARLFRAQYLLAAVEPPQTNDQAKYNVQAILNTLTVPYNKAWNTETAWISIKDLKNRTIYYQDLMTPDGNNPTFDQAVSNWTVYKLDEMGLDTPHPETPGLQAFNQDEASQINITRVP